MSFIYSLTYLLTSENIMMNLYIKFSNDWFVITVSIFIHTSISFQFNVEFDFSECIFMNMP